MRTGLFELAWAYGALGIAAIVVVWELYKLLAPADGVVIGGLRVMDLQALRSKVFTRPLT